jgi:hypothetical protein
VKAARGSPGNPVDPGAKVGELRAALDDLERPAAEVLRIAGLR